ncbi:hypothetical protein FCR2A7T_10650 [Flavobacterium cauense R2A-7]|uniref:Uncharacterized protein (TIGR03643 family) n=1 Tax=Flavobacterium cauense R2A-7 TaxID=1341154 RepID=V6S8P7_9FLAO|nr:TIGR03643 family protein [Flavobacterium cauense]ESU20755.1 hypothetical protein FCR2A7T_10650 [Flavobacterium cauense R2A-7]KGO82876.1 hypothetical protein Q762_03740 [Flavobacterium cauense R2A-7]TWI10851.1 uncharacterized protein (TIGR03643 family) [Flavobacterium cauense R2A-7]
MQKRKISEMDNETLERVVTMAQEEKKPFEVLKEEFGISENDVTELMRKKLSKDNFELWKKKVTASKPKPKPLKFNEIEDDDLDSKYYFKNKMD